MHASHQAKLLNAGFTIYSGTTVGDGKLAIKAKTPDNHNWHTIEKNFATKVALKKRLHELDTMPKMIDLYDTKNQF
jgi:hypothetical protein